MLRKAVMLAAAALMLTGSAAWAQTQGGPDPTADNGQAERLVNILRTTNKAQVTYYVPQVFELQNVNPYDVVRFLVRAIQPEEGALYTFADPDGGGKVIVIAPQYQMQYIAELIEVIDREQLTSSDGAARAYVRLKHRSVADEDFLNVVSGNGQFGNFTLITDPPLDAVYIKDVPSALKDHVRYLQEWWDVPTAEVSVDVTIYEVDANNDNAVGLDFHAWKNGPGRNLFSLGAFAEYGQLSAAKEQLAGIDLGGEGVFNDAANLLDLPARKYDNDGANAAYYYEVPSAYFDYLNVKGMARLVTQTKLSILNAHQGSISTGGQVLYYQTQNGPAPAGGTRAPGQVRDPFGDNVSFPDNRTVAGSATDRSVDGLDISGYEYDRDSFEKVSRDRSIGAVETGVFLDIVPVIATGGRMLPGAQGDAMITMDLAYCVSQLTGFDGEGVPQVASRTDTTTVRALDGEEIIVGGLVREEKIKTTRKVPILGSIPVVGYLFGGEVSTAKRSMVAIVLKPTVINNYDSLMGTPDETLVQQVSQEIPTFMPTDQYGFDMYLMDKPAKDASVSIAE